jgi:hypothetical protein
MMTDERPCLSIPRDLSPWTIMAAAFGTGESSHLSVLLGYSGDGRYAVAVKDAEASMWMLISVYDARHDGEEVEVASPDASGEPATIKRPPALQLATLDWAARARPFLAAYGVVVE